MNKHGKSVLKKKQRNNRESQSQLNGNLKSTKTKQKKNILIMNSFNQLVSQLLSFPMSRAYIVTDPHPEIISHHYLPPLPNSSKPDPLLFFNSILLFFFFFFFPGHLVILSCSIFFFHGSLTPALSSSSHVPVPFPFPLAGPACADCTVCACKTPSPSPVWLSTRGNSQLGTLDGFDRGKPGGSRAPQTIGKISANLPKSQSFPMR